MLNFLSNLTGVLELQQHVFTMIFKVGGGWKIDNWNESGFVQSFLSLFDTNRNVRFFLVFYQLIFFLAGTRIPLEQNNNKSALWNLFTNAVSIGTETSSNI
jgi:hypothetical protein